MSNYYTNLSYLTTDHIYNVYYSYYART